MTEYRLEMAQGQPQRQVDADAFTTEGDWLVFYRKPMTGGERREYWRVRTDCVVSMETKR